MSNRKSSTKEEDNQQYEIKIRELMQIVASLEGELQEQQVKNEELKKRVGGKEHISFDKRQSINSKHLSDTEDSLILSEKKSQGLKRSASSILDVKIKPGIQS